MPKPNVKKEFKLFTPRVRSRHPSHDPLRGTLQKMPFRSVVRFGSITEIADDNFKVHCNTPAAVKNSASKFLMKHCFIKGGVVTAPWMPMTTAGDIIKMDDRQGLSSNDKQYQNVPFPLIIKHIYGSRGTGNYKIDTPKDLEAWKNGKNLKEYIVEQYKTYSREYRLHVTEEGCFYTCRKMLKNDTPEDKKFQRHDDNCVWILEENAAFDKPVNWNAIVADCVKALKSLGLDVGAFDLKVQSAKDQKGKKRENPEWIVIESCSAPSFGKVTTERYLAEIPKILMRKAKEQGVLA